MDSSISEVLTFLETDLKELLDILNQENVFEVMLNEYKAINGSLEGHVWYEAAGKGMRQVFTPKTQNLPSPYQAKLGQSVFLKQDNNGNIFNYRIINQKQMLKDLKVVLSYTIQTDKSNISYFEQEELYKLFEFANAIQQGQYATKEYIPKNSSVEDVLPIINSILKRQMKLDFHITAKKVTPELLAKLPKCQYSISKEFLKYSASKVEQVIGVVAAANGLQANEFEPIIEAKIPVYGHRFTATLPPVCEFPMFCIRKHMSQTMLLEDYVAQGVMPEKAANIIHDWIKKKYNFLVVGSVGSGKTTLLNTCLDLVNEHTPNDRVGVLEDTPEIQLSVANAYKFKTSPEINLTRLLKTSLRFSANRLIVGEIRGSEAYVLMKAMTSGFMGCLGTLHASGAEHALSRFEQCLRENEEVQRINKFQVASAIQGIISIQKVSFVKTVKGIRHVEIRRRVTAIKSITGYYEPKDTYSGLWLYKDPEAFMLTDDYIASSDGDFT